MYGEFILVYCLWTSGELCDEEKILRLDLLFPNKESCERYQESPENRNYILREFKGIGENVYVITGCQSNPFMTEPL